MKLRLALLALALALTLSACDVPLWANFEVAVRDAEGDAVSFHYCISWERRGVMFYCQQPEDVKVVELKAGQVLKVMVVNQVMP